MGSAASFDPYYEWLGIGPKDQPPDHYRLLGVERFEANESVIAGAADRQMGHVRTFQSGPRSRQSQQLLNQISAARVCLLSAEKKRRYDEQLRAQLGSAPSGRLRRAEALPDESAKSEALPPAPRASSPAPAQRPAGSRGPAAVAPGQSAALRNRGRSRAPSPWWQRPVVLAPALIAAALLIAGAAIWAVSTARDWTPIAGNPSGEPKANSASASGGEAAPTDDGTVAATRSRPNPDEGDSPFQVVPEPGDSSPEAGSTSKTSAAEPDPDALAKAPQPAPPPLEFEIVEPAPTEQISLDELLRPQRMFAGTSGEAAQPADAAGAKSSKFGPLGVGELARFTGATGALRAMAVSRDGKYVAAGGDDKTCYILDAKTLRPVRTYGPHGASIVGLAWMNNGTLGVSTVHDTTTHKSIYFWDWDTQQQLIRLGDNDQSSYDLAISLDDQWCAIALDNRHARIYHIGRNERLGLEDQQPSRLNCVAFSPDSRLLLLGKAGRLIPVGISPAGQVLGVAPRIDLPNQSAINDLVFNPDGKSFLVASEDGSIATRSGIDCRLVGTIDRAHDGGVRAVAVSSDAKSIASGGADNKVRLWQPEKSQRPVDFLGHQGAITGVAFVADDTVVSASEDGTVRLWKQGSKPKEQKPASSAAPSGRAPFEKIANDPPPTDEALAAAIDVVHEVFATDFRGATHAAAREALAKKLLAEGEKPSAAAGDRYALLSEARRLAIEAAAVGTALKATQAIAARYDVDAFADLATTIDQLAATVRTPKQCAELTVAACDAAQETVAGNRFDLAQQIAKRAASVAVKSRDPLARRRGKEIEQEVATARAQWEAVRGALQTLRTAPADADAQLLVGKYLLLARGLWERGLKRLAQGSDPDLRALAEADLAQPATPQGQLALADRWKAQADRASESEQQTYLGAAEYWYRRAADKLTGLPKIRTDRALEELSRLPQAKRRTQ